MAGVSLLSVLLLLAGMILLSCVSARGVRVRRQNMKVLINATADTIVMKFVRPSTDVNLEGYILGYGSSMFSNQFIPLPDNGKPYEMELDAEPKYLVAVRPIAVDHVKKLCSGKVNLVKPLHLLIGSISPTAVLLSWGNHLKTPSEGDMMTDCLEDGFYTIRYRERNRKWIYQTCPTSDVVIDNLKQDTPYEFGVRSNKDDRSGSWSQAVVHSTNTGNQKPSDLRPPLAKTMRPRALSPPRPASHNRTQPPLPPLIRNPVHPGAPPTFVNGLHHPPKHSIRPRDRLGSFARPSSTFNKKSNLVGKPGGTDKLNVFKTIDKQLVFNHKFPPATIEPAEHTTTASPSTAAVRQETWEDSDLFKSEPTSDLDAMGKKRYVAPHVVYQTGKKQDEPCSITSSLNYFPENERGETNVTAPPRSPPSNITVVTVEGCPSFVILDWEKADNDTTEYEVISTAKGPDGEQVSVLTTDRTHTAVENLKPESSYEFTVKPKNDLGAGPSSDPVTFNTESADPRVSENASGKDAIWTQFPFKTDSYSDCHGKQFVKRTWYRKFVGVQLCNSLRYKIYLSDSLNGKFHNIGDQAGFGEDHCQFVDSFLDGRTGRQVSADQLPSRHGFYRAVRQEPVHFGQIGGRSHMSYVAWYECGMPIPGKW